TFKLPLDTMVHAATSVDGQRSSRGDSPTESSFSAAFSSWANLAICLSRTLRRMVSSFSLGGRAVASRKANDKRSSAVLPSRSKRSASLRLASTYVGSFIKTRAWSGVLVRPRRTVQVSRSGASKVSICGGGEVRFQNVYIERR